jgi:hypothetical protein
MRGRLFVVLAAFVVGLAAAPAGAKEGVVASIDGVSPSNAEPGERVTIAWTLAAKEERGKRRPFGASGVFVKLLSATGAKPTTAVASGDGDGDGKFQATVVVPEGGVGDVEIGLHGISSGPNGTSVSDLYFPLRNNPFPASADAPNDESDEGGGDVAAWTIALAVVGSLSLGALIARRWKKAATGIHRPSPSR